MSDKSKTASKGKQLAREPTMLTTAQQNSLPSLTRYKYSKENPTQLDLHRTVCAYRGVHVWVPGEGWVAIPKDNFLRINKAAVFKIMVVIDSQVFVN